MDDPEIVDIWDSSDYLATQLLGSLFWNLEVPLWHVVMEVSSWAVLNYDIKVGITFKEVDQLDQIGMLTHFKHLYLPVLQLHLFFIRIIGLFHKLASKLVSCLIVFH
jgi:hypothetical protein